MTDDTSQAAGPQPSVAAPVCDTSGRRLFLWLAVAVGILYLLGLNGYWRFQRDSALYIGLARNLAETGELAFNGRAQPEALPGLPVLLAGVYAVAGESFLLMNAVVSAMAVGTILLAWLLFRELPLTRRQALACTAILGLSRTLYYYSTHLMTEVPFMFWAVLALWCGARMIRSRGVAGWCWCAGAALAAAISCTIRPVGPAVLIGLLAALWWRPGFKAQWGRRIARSAAVVTPSVAFLAWLAFWVMSVDSGPGESAYYTFAAKRGPLGMVAHLFMKIPRLIEALPETVLGLDLNVPGGILLLALIIPGIFVSLRRGERLLTFYAAACMAAAMLGAAGDRYLLPALPGIVYWIVLGFVPVWAWLGKRVRRLKNVPIERPARVLLALVLLGNFVRVSDVIYEARQLTARDFYRVSEGDELLDYWDMIDALNDPQAYLQPLVVSEGRILAHEGRMIHYFTGVPTRPLHGKRARRMNASGLLKLIRNEAVGFVVRDPDDEDVAAMIDKIRTTHPDALVSVRSFGPLELLRVDVSRLGEPER